MERILILSVCPPTGLEHVNLMGYGGEKYFKEIGMKQISEGVFFIPGQDEFIPDSHVYVVGKPDSGDPGKALTGSGGLRV